MLVVEHWQRLRISTRLSSWKTYLYTNWREDYQVFFFILQSKLILTSFFPTLGLRVAQVRLLFNLPTQFGTFPHPLAYIEWFTRLGSPDDITGLYSVTRSTRQGQQNAEVVSVDRIIRGCHLIPRFGPAINPGWNTDNILEQSAIHFFVNAYINVDSFSLLKPAFFNE